MQGFTWFELITFINQLGLALAGASALWGIVFLSKAARTRDEGDRFCLESLSGRLVTTFAIGFVVFLLAWISFSALPEAALSHEGVVVIAEHAQVSDAMSLKTPLSILFAILGGVLLIAMRRRSFKYLMHLYVFLFVLASVLISLPAWTGGWAPLQVFFVGHGWHSILTVGTVLVIDFLFHNSYKDESLRRVLYPNFDMMSKAIWIGLGVEFIAVSFILGSADTLFTAKFFFMQIVVAILIINGALLSGPITKKLAGLVKAKGGGARGQASKAQVLSGRWGGVAAVSGVLSIVSWLSITFVDSFADLSFSLSRYLFAYLTLIFIGIAVYFLIERHPVVGV